MKRVLVFVAVFFLWLPSLIATADPSEQPRANSWRSLGLDEKLANGNDWAPNSVAVSAIVALLVPGTSLPQGLTEADARIILRSAVKSGALDEKGRFGSDLWKALGIKKLKKEFFFNEAREAVTPLPLANSVRSELESFLYAFIVMARVAQLDLVPETGFERLENNTRNRLLAIGITLVGTSASDKEKNDFLQRIIGYATTSAMDSSSETPRPITDNEERVLLEFFGELESGSFANGIQEQSRQRSVMRTPLRVGLWVAGTAAAFTLWRYNNYINSMGMSSAMLASFHHPFEAQAIVTAIPSFFSGLVGYLVHRDRNRLRHLVQREPGVLSAMGNKVVEVMGGTKDLCAGLLLKLGSKGKSRAAGQAQEEVSAMDVLREAHGID